MESENSNAVNRLDFSMRVKESLNIVEELIMNLTELVRLLNSIGDGTLIRTYGQRSVLYAHLSIWQDATSVYWKSTETLKERLKTVHQWENRP